MFRHGVTVNVLSNNVATLYGHSGVREDEQFKFKIRLFLFDFLIFLFSYFNLNVTFFSLCLNFLYSSREVLKIGLDIVEATMFS